MEYTLPTRPGKVKNIVGQTFGRLTVTKLLGKRVDSPNANMFWLCTCECGKQVEAESARLRAGNKNSCGCLVLDVLEKNFTKHGASRKGKETAEYRLWKNIKARCLNSKVRCYPRYGGRGIKVCNRWLDSFEDFLKDVGPRPSPRHSLDRKDNDGNYEPGNVRWATPSEQRNNTRRNVRVDYEGESYTLTQLSGRLGVSFKSLRYYHFTRKLPLTEAISRAKRA